MYNITKVIALLLALGSGSQIAWAHGEQKEGPHGGYIRMPGAFHTEVMPDGNRKLKIFLLDVEFKNPTTQNSSVKVNWRHKGRDLELLCTERTQYFSCELPKGSSLSKGELTIQAKRDQAIGGLATYDLPLSLGH